MHTLILFSRPPKLPKSFTAASLLAHPDVITHRKFKTVRQWFACIGEWWKTYGTSHPEATLYEVRGNEAGEITTDGLASTVEFLKGNGASFTPPPPAVP